MRRLALGWAAAMLISALLAACAEIRIVGEPSAADLSSGAFDVQFEFDPIDLAPVVKSELLRAGISVASPGEAAKFMWTGTYAASYDVAHHRFDFAQFKIVDLESNSVPYRITSSQGGSQGVDAVVREMVARLLAEHQPKKP